MKTRDDATDSVDMVGIFGGEVAVGEAGAGGAVPRSGVHRRKSHFLLPALPSPARGEVHRPSGLLG